MYTISSSKKNKYIHHKFKKNYGVFPRIAKWFAGKPEKITLTSPKEVFLISRSFFNNTCRNAVDNGRTYPKDLLWVCQVSLDVFEHGKVLSRAKEDFLKPLPVQLQT